MVRNVCRGVGSGKWEVGLLKGTVTDTITPLPAGTPEGRGEGVRDELWGVK